MTYNDHMTKTVRVLSLGAGVQSSALCYMYQLEKLKDFPDFAVFADTQAEPQEVYSFLKKLQKDITIFPIYTATKGDLRDHPNKIPFFVRHPNGKKGMGWRQCTNDFKVQVVIKKIRDILGYKPRQRWKHHIEMVMGISYDEIGRKKTPQEKWRTNAYPLIDKGLTRQDCIDFCKSYKLNPPRSACIMCPYRSKKEWAHMKKQHPKDFEAACQYDEKIRLSATRMGKGLSLEQYIRPELIPLRNIDLDHLTDNKQMDLQFGMANECEGMCGV